MQLELTPTLPIPSLPFPFLPLLPIPDKESRVPYAFLHTKNPPYIRKRPIALIRGVNYVTKSTRYDFSVTKSTGYPRFLCLTK